MKYISTSTLLLLSLLSISCGENTTTSPLKDIVSIKINDKENISIYSTDINYPLTGTVFYNDSSNILATGDMAWSSLDSTILGTSNGNIYARKNGGDTNLTIDYQSTFSDTALVHVKELLSINYSDLNLSISDAEQIIYVTGNFENNETNITMNGNIFWSVDANATLSEANASAITLSVLPEATSVKLTGTLFTNTENNVSFSHIYTK